MPFEFTPLTLSIILIGIGIVFLALSTISWRVRAVLNKRAWNGPTLPLAFIGLPIFIAGLVLLYFNYPN